MGKTKIKYRVDPLNRLVLGRGRIADGRFKIGKSNQLLYYLKPPNRGKEQTLPFHKIAFSGRWSLDPEHNLRLNLYESKTKVFGDTLSLKGDIERTDAHSLTFALRKRRTPKGIKKQLLNLKGSWQADSKNRLTFLVEKRKEPPDKLIFQNAWEINKNNEIVYRYEKIENKFKIQKSFGFRGFWDIESRRRLIYLLDRIGKSKFCFKVALQTPTLRAQQGKIKYLVGIGVRQGKALREVIIFGKWKVKKDLSLVFEVKYGKKRKRAINFEATKRLGKGNKVVFGLLAKKGERLGIEVAFNRSFFKDAQSFIRLRQRLRESRVEAGLRMPF